MMAKCEKCGKKIETLMVDVFNHDGSDSFYAHEIAEYPENAVCVDAVCVDVDPNWTGNELSEEEMPETIKCPHCGEFPFKSTEIQTATFVRIIMFKEAHDGQA